MKAITLLELEYKASNSDYTQEDFKTALWHELVVKKNRKQVNQFSKDLNIYPHPANVYHALLGYFFSHIQQWSN